MDTALLIERGDRLELATNGLEDRGSLSYFRIGSGDWIRTNVGSDISFPLS